MINYISAWWLTNPSEKYESQLGLWFPTYGKKHVPNHQPALFVKTNQLYLRPRILASLFPLRKKQGQKFSWKFYQEKVVTSWDFPWKFNQGDFHGWFPVANRHQPIWGWYLRDHRLSRDFCWLFGGWFPYKKKKTNEHESRVRENSDVVFFTQINVL